ncbi:acetylxylan esterase [Singulisphaera sp. Ch08]|uniref:Acetylxylan esterase n=1 Tax=Singulisphaera sp. Ch08 TaxID=3120278 RepID=A0AAU7CAM0_9BACT
MATRTIGGWVLLGLALFGTASSGRSAEPLAEYFRIETERLAARPLLGIDSAERWKASRPELQRQCREMLGLDPMPEKTDLNAKITGVVERPDFVIEKIHFQSAPGLFVTGNLYRPKVVTRPLPAILYVCGHGGVVKNGLIYGCKAHYQHHAAWYAANGYVCLVVDTLQLGELPGLHHGTHHLGMWWWISRGYTPAGIEAWNGVRVIDYLTSRPEVDPTRIGMTGRSGGGATSWWLAAIDDRVAAVAPVAGITDLTDHVVDGVIKGHCDCMYFVNLYRWDFPLVAALTAPRPLLFENTDKDPIFPEDGVRRIYGHLEQVYRWYGASDRLGLVIGAGGHIDSTEIRHPSFAFFNKWLKGQEGPIEEPDRKVAIEDLKVLKPGEVPPGNRNDTIHETFLPEFVTPPVPASPAAWESTRDRWMGQLRAKVFAGWPSEDETPALDLKRVADLNRDPIRIRVFDYTSQPGVRLTTWLITAAKPGREQPDPLTLVVADETAWRARWSWLAKAQEETFQPPQGAEWTEILRSVEQGSALAIIAPRGVGPTGWDEKNEQAVKMGLHIRRRFPLLGQTLEGMQIWDVRRALAALRTVPELGNAPVELVGRGQAAALALWTAVFEPGVAQVTLDSPPVTVRDGPAFLNLSRVLGMPQALALLYPRTVRLVGTSPEPWRWASDLATKLGGNPPWPTFDHAESR